jgi:hypothetical protein
MNATDRPRVTRRDAGARSALTAVVAAALAVFAAAAYLSAQPGGGPPTGSRQIGPASVGYAALPGGPAVEVTLTVDGEQVGSQVLTADAPHWRGTATVGSIALSWSLVAVFEPGSAMLWSNLLTWTGSAGDDTYSGQIAAIGAPTGGGPPAVDVTPPPSVTGPGPVLPPAPSPAGVRR